MRRPGISVGVALALPVAVLAAYWPALHAGFVWDDDGHVTRPDLATLGGLARIWTEPGATQQYYPVLHSAFWVEYHLWGGAPFGYHLTNVLLHIAVSLLLFAVLRKVSLPGAALAAAAFALHPVCVESVAWVSEQKNTLSAAFALGAALVYLRFDGDRRAWWYALATGLFALALLSKSVTATLPAVLLVLFWWRRGRLDLRADILPLVPWFALAAAAAVMTAWMERTYIGAYGHAFALGPVERVLVAGRVGWFYLGKILWPAHLSFNYPRWTVNHLEAWQYLYPLATLAVLAACFTLRRRTRGPLAAGLLFLGILFPALGFVDVYPFVFSYVADHFQYLAAAAMIAALTAGLVWVHGRLPATAAFMARLTAGCILLVLALHTYVQSATYRDPEVFYRTILAANSESWLAHANLGVILAQRGEVQESLNHSRESMRLNPSYPEAFNNYGNLMAATHHWAAAAEAYAGALRARPAFAVAEYNWGYALTEENRYLEAEPHLRNAIRLKPDYAEAHYQLANALGNAGLVPQAEAEYAAALRIRPDYPEANANLGLALAEDGNWQEALPHIEQAVRDRPAYAEARAYLGFALAQSGRYAEAVDAYRASLRLGPESAGIHYQISGALQKLGRFDEAETELEEGRRQQALHPGAGR
jgi:tetratricopeptide (TPR) repeat protein